jgi:alkanesulfonate monooxygenase SsuD/methylene tetrahydromethanopterin reductase-like flavin-dependent oxidoreductase (luciferase family)
VEYGAHLPLVGFDGTNQSLAGLRLYASLAAQLGFTFLCASDHLLFSRPWLDGPTALAAVLDASGTMRLATTVAIPVVRGPTATAKTLAALDVLSGGRLVVGVGPGSSIGDYAQAGVSFTERWQRFDEAIALLRAVWDAHGHGFHGRFYSAAADLAPRPTQQPGPPLWIGSWGSHAGLRRVARLGDGWLASGYNTTPETFLGSLSTLATHLQRVGKVAAGFPNGIATMWLYITEDRAPAEQVLADVLSPTLNRSVEDLRERLPIGPAEECARKLSAYAAVGAERVFVWPVLDAMHQLERFRDQVVPRVTA